MKNIWNIFCADWRRLTASVVAVVVLLGLCLVPCLYAWFNILSNWDPYGTASTSRISVAVASEDAGCEVLGLEVNIGALVLQGLESNDQMGWVFVDSRAEALDGVESGDYYAALIVPEEFTEDFVSILSGDLRHPQIQYYENEKKNAIAPKITSKAKTAVQEQINTTVIGKAAEALTTAGSVFKAMGLDSEALADGIMDKLTGARQEMAQLQQVLLSLKDVMNGADGLLTAASVTIADARGTVEDADAAAGSTVQLISTGLSAADTAYSDLLTVLNNTDKVLGDIEDALRSMDTSAADEALKADLHRKIQAAIAALEDQLAAAEDEALKAQLEDGTDAISLDLEPYRDEESVLTAFNELNLLTAKPVIYAANVAEDDLADDGASNPHVQAVREYATAKNSEVFVVSAEIEAEMSEMSDEDKEMFLEDLGVKSSGMDKLIQASYRTLGLMSFLTGGEDETRAWTIRIGTKAPQAAGKIHTDFERGFIKAEVINYKELLDCGSYAAAREKGLVRMEGKDYVVKDGDVIIFRFNV